jgi:hypothetical protein
VTARLPLAEGEALVWQGAPDPRRSGGAFLIHAVLGLIFAGVGTDGVLRATMPAALAVAFAAGGLLFLMLPWIMRSLATRTTFAITTTRLIIMRSARDGPRLRWVGYKDVADVVCHAQPDGSGDLSIHHRNPAENDFETGIWESLIGLPEIGRVEAEIRWRLPR